MFEDVNPQSNPVPAPSAKSATPPPPPRPVVAPTASSPAPQAKVEDMFADVNDIPGSPQSSRTSASTPPQTSAPSNAAYAATASKSSGGGMQTAIKFGIGFVVVVGAIGGTVYYLNQRSKAAADLLPQVAPVVTQDPSLTEQNQENLAVVPLVQTPSPAPIPAPSQPDALAPILPVEVIPPRDTDADGLSDDQERVFGTDPTSADTDGDLLSDYDEVINYGTNPRERDTDADGLTDSEEVQTYKTDPKKMDTDGDTYSDKTEIDNGYNPNGEGKLPTPTPAPAPVPLVE